MSAAEITVAWIAVKRSTEQQRELLAAIGKHEGRLERGRTEGADGVNAQNADTWIEGGRARAGGPFILNLGRGSGGPGRGGGGAETACAVRRK